MDAAAQHLRTGLMPRFEGRSCALSKPQFGFYIAVFSQSPFDRPCTVPAEVGTLCRNRSAGNSSRSSALAARSAAICLRPSSHAVSSPQVTWENH